MVTLGPTFYGCIIEGGCIIEVHNTLAICTLGPTKVALLERLAAIERPHYRGSTVLHMHGIIQQLRITFYLKMCIGTL